jgi:hypothetical protein
LLPDTADSLTVRKCESIITLIPQVVAKNESTVRAVRAAKAVRNAVKKTVRNNVTARKQ